MFRSKYKEENKKLQNENQVLRNQVFQSMQLLYELQKENSILKNKMNAYKDKSSKANKEIEQINQRLKKIMRNVNTPKTPRRSHHHRKTPAQPRKVQFVKEHSAATESSDGSSDSQ